MSTVDRLNKKRKLCLRADATVVAGSLDPDAVAFKHSQLFLVNFQELQSMHDTFVPVFLQKIFHRLTKTMCLLKFEIYIYNY